MKVRPYIESDMRQFKKLAQDIINNYFGETPFDAMELYDQ